MIANLTAWLEELDKLFLQTGFSSESIGSYEGIALMAYTKLAAHVDAPTVYISSGMHGDEPAGPEAIRSLLEMGFFSERYHWQIVPVINPIGLQSGTRENAQGLDLNRDYYHLKSEEVRNHVAWLEQQTVPNLMLSLHEDWESTGYYFYEINTRGDQPEQAQVLMKHLDSVMFREPELVIDDHDVRDQGWIYHEAVADEFENWPEAIYMADRGCPLSLTMETPSSVELRERVKTQIAFVQSAVDIWA